MVLLEDRSDFDEERVYSEAISVIFNLKLRLTFRQSRLRITKSLFQNVGQRSLRKTTRFRSVY